jgi:hypothetical protein
MKKGILWVILFWAGVALAQGPGTTPSAPPSSSSSQPVRPIGVVTQIQPGNFTLHTDAGPDLLVQLPEGVTVVRVPPGAKDLKAATKITVSDISKGDRVLVRGRVSDDQKSVLATSVIVMTQTDLAKAREAERLEWQRRGIGGLVRAINPQTKEIIISVPNTPPTPGNPTHPVTISLAANAMLLRYAPDSVKFSDAKPSTFDEVEVGDQVRALGTKSEDGSRFSAEKLVSGTFRTIGGTVVSIDAAERTVTVKDLASGKPVVVWTNADSRLHRLPPFIAQMIAAFNSGEAPAGEVAARPGTGGPRGEAVGGAMPGRPAGGGPGGGAGGGQWRGVGAGQGGGPSGGPRDFNQMLERTPPLTLGELKPGDALVVVSTQGAKPSEVTAIVMLAGVEPILSARPKGSSEVVLGPWNMSMGGGEGGP